MRRILIMCVCLGPAPFRRRVGDKKFALRSSNPAMAARRVATMISCSAIAVQVAITGNATPAVRGAGTLRENLVRRTGKPPGDPILHSTVHRNGVHATGRSQYPGREAGSGMTVGGNDINALSRQAAPPKKPGLRELAKGNRSRPRDMHCGKFLL